MTGKNEHIEYFDLIEDYLDGSLSGEEKSLFEKRLSEDKALSTEYEMRKKLAKLFQSATEYQQTKEHVKQILSSKKHSKTNLRAVFAIAASIIILVGVYFILKQNKSDNNNPRLVENDSTKVIQHGVEKREQKASRGYYHLFSQIPIGYEVEILTDTIRVLQNPTHRYDMKISFTIEPDMTISNACFYSYDSIPKGTYTYQDDSLIKGELYYKFKSIEKGDGNFIVHADSLRIKLAE